MKKKVFFVYLRYTERSSGLLGFLNCCFRNGISFFGVSFTSNNFPKCRSSLNFGPSTLVVEGPMKSPPLVSQLIVSQLIHTFLSNGSKDFLAFWHEVRASYGNKSDRARFCEKILVWAKMGQLGPKKGQNEDNGHFLGYLALRVGHFAYYD